jgi:hypothetical protein
MTQKHRGKHPEDAELFGERFLPALRTAAADYCLLLGKGYPRAASLKLVGDKHSLRERQRLALERACCPPDSAAARASKRLGPAECRGKTLIIDGHNVVRESVCPRA